MDHVRPWRDPARLISLSKGRLLPFIMNRIALSSLFISTVWAGSANYSVTVIPLPGGYTYGQMIGINNAGQVTGSVQNGTAQAFLGSPWGSSPIPLPTGWIAAVGSAVNASGQVAGSGSDESFNLASTGAFIGNPSGSTAIQAPAGWGSVLGYAVNNSGQVAGYGGGSGGFIGTPAGASAIALLPGTQQSYVFGVNNLGQVAGWAIGDGDCQPFIGTAAGAYAIPLIPGWYCMSAYAVNDSGQVAGMGFNALGVAQGFIGTTAGNTAIPLPPGANNASLFIGSLNNPGQVVGVSDAGGWIWDAANGTRLLNSLVPAGWTVDNAISISDNGLILASASYTGGPDLYVELTPATVTSGCTFSLTQPSAFLSANVAGGSVNVVTAAGCSWTASSNSSWLAISSGASGSGSGSIRYQTDPNPGPSYPLPMPRVAILTIGGLPFPVSQAAALVVSTLEPTEVNPAAGGGAVQTFTFTFMDSSGYGDLNVLDVLVSTFLDGQQACYFALAPTSATTGYLYLVDDAGDGGYVNGTPMPLPSSNVLQNSQCALHGAGSSISANGNTLTLTLAITFEPAFAGNKSFYMAARSKTQNSGWQAIGTWNVPGPAPTGPAVGVVFPARSTTTGEAYNLDGIYTFTFTDTSGFGDLLVLDVLTNSFLDGAGACYVAYVPTTATTGYLYLVDDAGDGGYAPGSPVAISDGKILQNQQCMVKAYGSSASANGNTLTLKLQIHFFYSTFTGNHVFFLAARNKTTGNSGWQAAGSVTVP